MIYDYAITLGAEIDLFWTRKPTGATALFVLNRYLLVLDYIFNIATIERSSEMVSSLHHYVVNLSLIYFLTARRTFISDIFSTVNMCVD